MIVGSCKFGNCSGGFLIIILVMSYLKIVRLLRQSQ